MRSSERCAFFDKLGFMILYFQGLLSCLRVLTSVAAFGQGSIVKFCFFFFPHDLDKESTLILYI